MTVPLEQFVKQLEDSGILASETLKDFLPPKSQPKDAEDLARELVRQKKLTKFQVAEVWRGQGKSLTLGNYVLMEKIGAGGMGEVFKAEHRRMHRIVAVKMLPADMMQNAAVVARFEREVTAVAKLNHPNIVTAFDADNANGVHLLIMEYVEGSDLAALIKKNGPFTVDQSVNCIQQAARGLQAAHAAGIVHRDIKPANLLLDKQGTVKILDLGLARLSDDADSGKQAELTNTGTIMGTVDYMAPEQALDTKTADARADIYSLGCSLFYLLTGKATYQGDTLMKKLLAHREQAIPSIRAIRPEVPEQIETVFCKMVAKRIEDRHQTMTEVIADLEAWGTGQELSANKQSSLASSTDTGLTDFLRDISLSDSVPARRKKSAGWLAGKDKKQLLLIGGSILGLLVLVLTIWSLSGTRSVQTADVKKRNAKPADAQEGWQGWPNDAPPPAIAPFTARQAKKHQETWAKYQKVDVEFENSLGMKFVLIPPGEFTMGSTPAEIEEAVKAVGGDAHWSDCIRSEAPQHKVILTQPIYLGINEVTQADYEKVMGTNPSHFAPMGTGKDAVAGMDTTGHPVEMVSWNDAAEFCARLSQREKLKPFYFRAGETVTPLDGTGYRLPTEAEWEFSCRAGTATKYWIGQKDEDFPQAGWFVANSGARTHALGELKANPFGLYDIHGNIWECVQDEWEPTYYAKFQEISALDPIGPSSTGSLRVVRGGDWAYIASGCRASVRYDYDATRRNSGIGFRVSLVVSAVKKRETTMPVTTLEDPAFQKWMSQVAVMPADEQAKAVAAKLRQLNPGFDGNVTPGIVNGIVTSFSFVTDKVTDIAPIAALKVLQNLNCPGSEPGLGQLSDLGPLRGLPLYHLNVGNTQVAELSPLEGMPLSVLNCNSTRLVDLSQLKLLPSLRHLYCSDTQISDLSPVVGSNLQALVCSRTQVSDLSPVHGMPLIALEFAGTSVTDLSPLRGMKLTKLLCQDTQVVDLSPLAGMKSLELLFIDDTPVSDLSPLKGLLLKTLHCVGTRVSDLSPLQGMPLTMLVLERSRVTDLSPIRGMPLFGIYFHDYRPERDAEILRSLRGTLQEINYQPAAVFWRDFEAQEAAIATWKKQVAALSAEEQVRAVAARLKEFNTGFDGKVAHKIENGQVIALAFVSDNVTDISPVRAIEGLQNLSCPGSAPRAGKLAELWPLRGTKVTHLNISHTAVSNLSPLSELKLAELDVSGCPVADLSALTRTGLARLRFSDTKVTDLGPLAGLPLTFLDYSRVCIADVSPLQKLPLQQVRCGFKPARDAAVLRSITTLEKIDGKPAATFWKEADARQAAFDRWMHDVESLPPERQVMAVAKKLKELNPGFDGQVKHDIGGGVVVRLDFNSNYVTDMTPVRALWGLTILDCSGSDASIGKLADLWPLKGLPLISLNCGVSQVADLSPLKATSLQALSIDRTEVCDLSPLAGMPLSSLHCGHTKVADLSPLHGTPLTNLNMGETIVTDLSPLRGMQLTALVIAGAPISDLSPLKGMPLTSLVCSRTRVTTLAPLKGMPLTVLECAGMPVTDLSPLAGMPVTQLWCDFSPLRDAQVLRTLKKLEKINNKSAAEFWKEVDVRPAGN